MVRLRPRKNFQNLVFFFFFFFGGRGGGEEGSLFIMFSSVNTLGRVRSRYWFLIDFRTVCLSSSNLRHTPSMASEINVYEE